MNKQVSKWAAAEQARQSVRGARARAVEVAPLDPPTIKESLLADPADNTVKNSVLLNPAENLIIDLQAWDTFAPPDSGLFDTLYVYHTAATGGPEEMFNREFNADDKPGFPFAFTVPKAKIELWGEGEHKFSCEVQPYNGGDRIKSDGELSLIFDRVPPYGQALPAPFTPIADVTDANIDSVDLAFPEYDDYKAGDTVHVYWLKSVPDVPSEFKPVVSVPVQAPPQALRVPKKAIEDMGDGGVYALYLLVDKAGNISKLSQYLPVGVAIGPLPTGLQDPVVPLAPSGDGLIDQEDVFTGVSVQIPEFSNFKPTDELEVTWGTLKLGWQPIGNAPRFPLVVNLTSLQVWEQYGSSSSGDVQTPVSYELRRGAVSAGSKSIDVNVNLERIGPVDPNPDPEWPGPVNPKLGPVTVTGAISGKANELTPADETHPASLTFLLDAAFKEGDNITFYWGGQHIADADYPVENGDPGSNITCEIPWEYIEAGKNGTVPVHYEITRTGIPNKTASPSTDVLVNAIVLRPEAPAFLGGNTEAPVGWLGCKSLFDPNDPTDTVPSIRVQVPDLAQYGLTESDTVTMHWTAVHGYSGDTKIPGIDKTEDIALTGGKLNGFVWRIEPYDKHILPIPNYSTTIREGRGRVTYSFTLEGKPYTSLTLEQIVSMHQLGAACPLRQ
ncbi:hypothetical protein QEM35_003796 [Pseudomonas putida]|nr:hypothetical protein [Pseudomonas putida]EKT4514649.1 hypothetical protein [Pseudomonas putida]